MKIRPDYTIYADGSCLIMQDNLCGYGAIIIHEDTKFIQEISGALPDSKTSQQAELMAVSMALKSIPEYHHVHLITDCSLVFNTVRVLKENSDNYAKYTEFNNGLGVYELVQQFKRLGSEALSVEIVAGHGPRCPDFMHRADTLAKEAAKHSVPRRKTLTF